MKFRVSFAAIYDVTVEVDAESEAQAMAAVQNGGWYDVVDQSFNRHHPDTDFFIEAK